MPAKIQASKEAKAKAAMAGGNKMKKKWSRGKAKDVNANDCLINPAKWNKLKASICKMKVITISKVSSSHGIMGSVAIRILDRLHDEGHIKLVYKACGFRLYTKCDE